MVLRILSLIAVIFSIAACNSDYVPKPRGYYKVPLPQHQYQVFDKPGYPYTFEYPVYATVVQDTTFFEEKPDNPYWINIDFPQFNSRIYVSYNQIGKQSFDRLRDDAYKMTYKHTLKATSIEDSLIETPQGIKGVFFNVGGNAATGRQFFLSDTSKHFLRGALYFDATPNEDSLSIVNAFLEQDMKHLINTFRWK
ncbi:MAG TPA: hypothetical protein VGD17_06935 [Chitinophagaceae bacterium]